MSGRRSRPRLRIDPLTPATWAAFVELFGPRGAVGGCWCMDPRLTRGQYEKQKGAGNRRAMKELVDGDGYPPGVLGFHDDDPIAWCSIEPRAAFSKLARSRVLAPVDDREVWSIVCLFVHRDHCGAGVSVAMIEGAVAHARSLGARCVEAYPVEPKSDSMPPVFACTGIASAFARAGFAEVLRRSPTRPVMRRALRPC